MLFVRIKEAGVSVAIFLSVTFLEVVSGLSAYAVTSLAAVSLSSLVGSTSNPWSASYLAVLLAASVRCL